MLGNRIYTLTPGTMRPAYPLPPVSSRSTHDQPSPSVWDMGAIMVQRATSSTHTNDTNGLACMYGGHCVRHTRAASAQPGLTNSKPRLRSAIMIISERGIDANAAIQQPAIGP